MKLGIGRSVLTAAVAGPSPVISTIISSHFSYGGPAIFFAVLWTGTAFVAYRHNAELRERGEVRRSISAPKSPPNGSPWWWTATKLSWWVGRTAISYFKTPLLFVLGFLAAADLGPGLAPLAAAVAVASSLLATNLFLARKEIAGRSESHRLIFGRRNAVEAVQHIKLRSVAVGVLASLLGTGIGLNDGVSAGCFAATAITAWALFRVQARNDLAAAVARAKLGRQLAAVLGVAEQAVVDGNWWTVEANEDIILTHPPAAVLAALLHLEARLILVWPDRQATEITSSRVVISRANDATVSRRNAAAASGGLFADMPTTTTGEESDA